MNLVVDIGISDGINFLFEFEMMEEMKLVDEVVVVDEMNLVVEMVVVFVVKKI
jgi:hypothetical protein